MSAGTVYVIQAGAYFKIGRTRDLAQRVNDLQVSNPLPITVIHTWDTFPPQRLERWLHRQLVHAKVRGEWFELTADEVLALKTLPDEAFEEGPAETSPRKQPLPEHVLGRVLPEYGCPTLTDLAHGLGLPKQYAWLMWHGKIALSVDMARRIQETFKVPGDVLLQITRATPEKRRGRRPSTPSQEGPDHA